MQPTVTAYAELQKAYDHFNVELFSGSLPDCLLTLQREKKTYGYFSHQRFVHSADGTRTDEIALNPAYFGVVPIKEVMQTIVHEMTHLWQFHFGKPGRARYHNREWADKMEALGLMPSDTGKPGGKRVGDCMGDYSIEGGLFEQSCNRLLTSDYRISWLDRFPARHVTMSAETFESVSEGIELAPETLELSKPTRAKFTCPQCKTNVWGKPSLKLICGECGETYSVCE